MLELKSPPGKQKKTKQKGRKKKQVKIRGNKGEKKERDEKRRKRKEREEKNPPLSKLSYPRLAPSCVIMENVSPSTLNLDFTLGTLTIPPQKRRHDLKWMLAASSLLD